MAIDYDAIFGGDAYDPCEALKALRPAYFKLVAEGGVQRVTFRDRTVEMRGGDATAMAAIITKLEGECAAKSGQRARFAITAGARRA